MLNYEKLNDEVLYTKDAITRIDAEDVEMLQDLVLAAVNEGFEKAQEMVASKMGALTGGLNIPGLA